MKRQQKASNANLKLIFPTCSLLFLSFLFNLRLLFPFHNQFDEKLLTPDTKIGTDRNVRGAFIHIGKTGGSTLTQLLVNGCHSFVEKPCRNVTNESFISKHTTYFHTPDFDLGSLKNQSFEFYVITLRDPLSRTISSYLHSHPDNQLVWRFDEEKQKPSYQQDYKKYGEIHNHVWKKRFEVTLEPYKKLYKCFPTLQDFAMKLRTDYPRDVHFDETNCSDVASLVLRHRVPLLEHLFWDISNIMTQIEINSETELVVIRTENLWNDWVTGNSYLGEVTTSKERYEHTLRNSTKYPIRGEVDFEGRLRLCNALRNEYHTYFQLLSKAKNLNRRDVEMSMRLARTQCPNLILPSSNS